MKKKRRPPLPPEYWCDLADLGKLAGKVPDWYTPGPYSSLRNLPTIGLSNACRLYMKDGPFLWKRKGVTIAEISDWKVLRTRIIEARRRPEVIMPKGKLPPRTTVLWWGKKFPLRAGTVRYYKRPDLSKL
jgi:hypothetical protein